MLEKVTKSDAEWRRLLTPEQYRITREKGTERPWSGRYHDFNGTGVYLCVCCGSRLFSSREKYAVPGKWPTFWAPIAPRNVKTRREISRFVIRNEVLCSRCDAHLGYVFEDGRPPAGVRYFINSAALSFVENCLRARRPDVGIPPHVPYSPAYPAYSGVYNTG
ncbi:MAG: peptide-methionine (R)-S-oxide reductase MsrB [Nitrospirae bacterium]|nr:peptide-methionine (R)-S-oxide reductase MsrB [Nitrospirota bacterium]